MATRSLVHKLCILTRNGDITEVKSRLTIKSAPVFIPNSFRLRFPVTVITSDYYSVAGGIAGATIFCVSVTDWPPVFFGHLFLVKLLLLGVLQIDHSSRAV